MKGFKVIIFLAIPVVIGMMIFVGMYFFLPANGSSDVEEHELTKEEIELQEAAKAQAALEEEARQEVERFKNEYGADISFEDMLEQIKIRKDYENKYHGTYSLEEVFLADYPSDPDVGDEGADAYFSTLERIQMYVEKYNIDESRYADMTAEEELTALEVEYGKLELPEEEGEQSEKEEESSEEDISETVTEEEQERE